MSSNEFSVNERRIQMKKVNVIKKGFISHKPDYLFGYCGWPSVARMPDGTLIAVCSGMRMHHLCFSGKTTMFISHNDGETWLGPVIVNDTPLDDRDAGILSMGGEKLLLTWFNLETKHLSRYTRARQEMSPQQLAFMDAATMNYSPELDEKWAGSLCRVSKDGGVTWGEAHRAPVTAPHGPILLRDGRLLYLGKDYGNKEPNGAGGAVYACVSCDDGATWEKLGTVPLPEGTHKNNFHEPHVIELPDGRLLGIIRYQHSGEYTKYLSFSMFQTESSDGGKTWSEAKYLGAEGSPPHLLRHSSGALVCVYGRRILPYGESAMISWDDGATWDMEYVIDTDAPSGDLGYPASVELDDGSIFTVYYQRTEEKGVCSLMYTRWELPERKG